MPTYRSGEEAQNSSARTSITVKLLIEDAAERFEKNRFRIERIIETMASEFLIKDAAEIFPKRWWLLQNGGDCFQNRESLVFI